MAVRRISPHEAKALMDQGYTYLDVRSIPEYDQGHPTGAHNAPLLQAGSSGMTANPDFLPVVTQAYPKEARLVIGCRSGQRSQRAALMLEGAGFTQLVEMRGGWAGETDPTGRMVEKGWSTAGLPTSVEPTPGGTWEDLHLKVR